MLIVINFVKPQALLFKFIKDLKRYCRVDSFGAEGKVGDIFREVISLYVSESTFTQFYGNNQ